MNTTFFLFPGLACTERLFGPQAGRLGDGVEVVVPEWVEPRRGETLEEFALRWGAATLDQCRRDGVTQCVVGGLSFGGMVSPLIGEFLAQNGVRVRGCVRISTVRFGDEIPWRFRLLWRALNLLPGGGWAVSGIFCRLALALRGGRMSPARREIFRQVVESPVVRCRRVVRMLYRWRGPERVFPFPIAQLHGDRDGLLPLRFTCPDVVVPGAGHCLTLTRPEAVNDFLREFLGSHP